MYRIEVTARARDDADAAHAWIAENVSPDFADEWYQDLFRQIETLVRFPRRCPVAAESRNFPEEIRELSHGKRRRKIHHRILFTIRGDVVSILYVYHSARKDLKP